MSEKKYYWFKLKEGFFDEKQIKYLRKLPEGDKLIIVYLKMQLKSLRTEGLIKYDNIMPSNVEELAMILDEDVNIVALALKALEKTKAIEILDDGSLYMLAMQDLIGKEGASAERVRKFRERQNQLALHGNTSVTNCNTEIEIEKELELDIEKNIKKREKNVSMDALHAIIDAYTPNQQLSIELKNHLEVRKTKKSALTRRAVELSLQKLDSLVEKLPSYKQEEEKIKIVQQSIDSGWIGFFEIKNKQQPKPKTALKSSFGNLEEFYDN